MKKIIAFFIITILLFSILVACDSTSRKKTEKYDAWRQSENASDYNKDEAIDSKDYKIWCDFLIWLDTEEAFDFNADRKINIVDYLFFEGYKDWKTSSYAIDLNGDRKISLEDYLLYGDSTKTNYVKWADSDAAVDLNSDGIIDEDDYTLAADYAEFIGTFKIMDFSFLGDIFCFPNSMFGIDDFERYVPGINFYINQYGYLSANFPQTMVTELGTDIEYVNKAIDSCLIRRLSSQIVTVDISIPSDSYYLSFYLMEDGNDYLTSFNYRYRESNTSIFFRIVYVNE